MLRQVTGGKAPSAWYTACWKWVFGQTILRSGWCHSTSTNQISFWFWTLEVGEPSFHWIECFQPSRFFLLSQGSIIPWWLLLQHLVFSTLATDPTGRSRWLILATGSVNSTGSVWPHFHGRYGHHVNIYRNISEGAPNWGPRRNLVLKQPLFHQKLQALGHQQGLPILVHRYLGVVSSLKIYASKTSRKTCDWFRDDSFILIIASSHLNEDSQDKLLQLSVLFLSLRTATTSLDFSFG